VQENRDDVTSWSDAVRYIALTEYYKGSGKSPALIPPYTTRVLVPLAASLLPFSSDTSINVINLCLTIAGLFILYKLMLLYGLSIKLMTWGLYIYTFSFPVFYYTTTGYIDASFMFFIYLSLLFILKDKFTSLIIVFVLGTAVKEMMVLVIPLYIIAEIYRRKGLTKIVLRTVILSVTFAVIILILRYFRPDDLNYIAVPDGERFLMNISRIRTYLSFILTFGISGFASIILMIFFVKDKKTVILKYGYLLIGTLMGVLVWIYSLFTAYSDGRFIWVSVPFTILLMLNLLRETNSKLK